jgi:2-iminobutanoate/2-iminopropanoate deaminase
VTRPRSAPSSASSATSSELHSAGAGLEDVISCLVHLRDLALFDEFNASYEGHFPGPAKPVRTTVRADLVAGMLVEVTVIAGQPRR